MSDTVGSNAAKAIIAIDTFTAAPNEAQRPAPWLRRRMEHGSEIRVVDLERGVERAATPAEIESGMFYKNHDEYIKEDAAA